MNLEIAVAPPVQQPTTCERMPWPTLTCRHLAKTGRSFCFRYVIPERLRPYFDCREIKKTIDKQRAFYESNGG